MRRNEMKRRSLGTTSAFSYPFGAVKGVFLVVFLLPFLGATAVMLFLAMGLVYAVAVKGFAAIGVGQLFLFCFAVIWSYIIISGLVRNWFGALHYATIVLDDKGISTRIAGLRVRTIAWRDVEKISKHRKPARQQNRSQKFSDYFTIESKTQKLPKWLLENLLGNIVFTDELDELQGLVRRINTQAKKRGIPLFFHNDEISGMSSAERRTLAKVDKKIDMDSDQVSEL